MSNPKKIGTWAFEPATDCVQYLADEMMLGATLKTALINQTGMHVLMGLVQDKFRSAGVDLSSIRKAIDHCAGLAPTARKHVEEKFHSVNLHTIVNMWAAALNALEQTIANCVIHDVTARTQAFKMTGEKSDPVLPMREEVAAGIGSRLVQWSTAKKGGKPAQIAYVDLCEQFDIPLRGSKRLLYSDLEEVRCVRNCFIHRRGVIDEHSCERVSTLRPLLGSVPVMDDARAVRYVDSINGFIVCLADATIHSRYCIGPKDAGS